MYFNSNIIMPMSNLLPFIYLQMELKAIFIIYAGGKCGSILCVYNRDIFLSFLLGWFLFIFCYFKISVPTSNAVLLGLFLHGLVLWPALQSLTLRPSRSRRLLEWILEWQSQELQVAFHQFCVLGFTFS